MLFLTKETRAQWTSEPYINTKTTTASLIAGDKPDIVASLTDGSYFVRWVQHDNKGRYKYAMYVQKFDKKGHRLWGDLGIRFDTLIGDSRFKDGMILDNNGNLVVGTQNTRLDHYKQFPVIYKIDGNTGDVIWKAEIDTVAGANDYQGLAPTMAVTPSNDVIVCWNNSVARGNDELGYLYMQKINGATGNFMWPQRKTIWSSNDRSTLFPQPIVLNNTNFIVTWEYRPAGSAGSTPFNIVAQKFRIDDAEPVWSNPTEISPANPIAPGGPSKYFEDKQGGIIIYYGKSGSRGMELYAQRIDTATGATKWGTESKLVSKNTIGASSNDAGAVYDYDNRKLWVAILQDIPSAGLNSNRIYLQALDLNGNRLLAGGDSTRGPEILPITNGGAAEVRQTIGMRNTGDGLLLVYAQGIAPARTLVKATKVDYTTAENSWKKLDADSIITVSSVKGISSGVLSEYVPVDSQVVIAMRASTTLGDVELAQNIKSTKTAGGTLGNGILKQEISFDTTTLYLTYGDAVPYLGGTCTAGTSPTYSVDDESIAYVDDQGEIQILKAGVFRVYAYFPGTELYISRTSLPKRIVVSKRHITVTAESKSIEYGHSVPTLTMQFNDFINGDDIMSFTKLPTITTPAVYKSPIGVYPINLQGGVSPKYEPVLVNGTLTIYPLSGSEKDKLEAYCSSPGTLQVNIYSTQEQSGVLQLIDMTGKIVYTQKLQLSNTTTNIQIPVYTLAPAIYIARFAGTSVLDQKVKIK